MGAGWVPSVSAIVRVVVCEMQCADSGMDETAAHVVECAYGLMQQHFTWHPHQCKAASANNVKAR